MAVTGGQWLAACILHPGTVAERPGLKRQRQPGYRDHCAPVGRHGHSFALKPSGVSYRSGPGVLFALNAAGCLSTWKCDYILSPALMTNSEALSEHVNG